MMEMKRKMFSEVPKKELYLRYLSEEESDEDNCLIEFERVLKIEQGSEDKNIDIYN